MASIYRKSIIIIGAGPNQLNLIIASKENGYTTIVIDPNIDAPGKPLADFFYCINPTDFDGHCKIIEKHKAEGIVTSQMDKPLQFMSKIASKYGFNFISEEVANFARNKFLMKERFIKNNVPCAKGVLLKDKDNESLKKIEILKFPLIIKPVDSYSSRGVYVINQIEEVKKYFDTTASFSTDGSVLLEEYLHGKMISVEGFVSKQQIEIIQYTERYKFTPKPFRVELGHIQPAILNISEKQIIDEVLINGIKALKLNNCGFHAELKINEKGVFIIEIGARLGGDFNASHLVPLSTGINIEKIISTIAMGDKPELPKRKEQFVMIKWLEFAEERRIKYIPDIESIRKINKEIIEIKVNLEIGMFVPKITDSAKRAGHIIAIGNSRNKVIENALECEKLIQDQVEYL